MKAIQEQGIGVVNKTWSEDEISILKENYVNSSKEEMMNLLDRRTWCAIKCKARDLGVTKRKKWTDEEVAILKEKYNELGAKGLAPIIGRTDESIRNKVRKLGLKYFPIKQFHLKLSDREIGYIAGIIDGEGYLNLRKHTQYRGEYIHRSRQPLLIIANTNMDVLKKCKRILRYGTIDKVYCSPKNTRRRKQCFQLRIMSIGKIHAILNEVITELVVKKERAKLMLAFCKSRINKSSKTPYSKRELAIAHKIHVLNKRGV